MSKVVFISNISFSALTFSDSIVGVLSLLKEMSFVTSKSGNDLFCLNKY